jgi:hypothetical protein
MRLIQKDFIVTDHGTFLLLPALVPVGTCTAPPRVTFTEEEMLVEEEEKQATSNRRITNSLSNNNIA